MLGIQIDLQRLCRCLRVDLMLSTRDLHKATATTVVQWLYAEHTASVTLLQRGSGCRHVQMLYDPPLLT